MQKSFIAIALALTLTSAFAGYTATNYAKLPIQVAADNETNFTSTGLLTLASITSGNVYLLSGNATLNLNNVTASNWNLWYRQLNAKTLATSQNYNAVVVAPILVFFLNNYVVGLNVDNDTNVYNLRAYQIPLTGGTGPGRVTLSSNNNTNPTILPVGTTVGTAQIGNTVYVAYYAANNTANITSFVVGGTTVGTTFTLSTTFDTPASLSLAWGEALGSGQLFATWKEANVLKDAIINVSKGTVSAPTAVPGYTNTTQTICSAFATDSKLYGEFCTGPTTNPTGNTLFWVRTYGTGNNTLVQIANYTTNTSGFIGFVPYGPYIAVFFLDTTATAGVNYVYEIWALDTLNTTILKPRTQYLNINSNNSTQVTFRVPSGGYYTLLYNNAPTWPNGTINGTISSIFVGLLLGSSYLASVLGLLLTIVAGLLLF
jgi:hypothetical protein